MIRGIDLFRREAISPDEKKILKAANKTASDLFRKRYSPGLKDNWDVPVNDLTLEQVEESVVESIKLLKNEGRDYAKNIVRERTVGQS